MAPSRGLGNLLRISSRGEMPRARKYSSFSQNVAKLNTQVYISRTRDPYLNLSIEHFLLQTTPRDSTILFLYTNSPSVIIGRNQNPWVEVNLPLLAGSFNSLEAANPYPISLVRRRSGGGTVFHDEGNVNYSVICPTAVFNRDKHASMVVRALRKLGVHQAQVNQRHDIVLDFMTDEQPRKVSGSAYKLTRLRSLHHGTCLLSSPNINSISQYLRSPLKPYIKARGVDSVSSPVANVNIANEAFENAVVEEFCHMYGQEEPTFLNDEVGNIPEIASGLSELKSLEWTYLQTPQFTFSTQSTEEDPRSRPPLPKSISSDANIVFTARNGVVTEANIDLGKSHGSMAHSPNEYLLGKQLHTIKDWKDTFPPACYGLADRINQLFGTN